ncbi:MAG: sensor histidine kinase [Polyangiales bacterium]
MAVDYKAYPILYVDDEAANLVALRYALEDEFTFLTTSSPEEALRILQEQSIAVLLADQRMPGMTGVELCERARDIAPDTMRIIITAYADLHAAVDAINRGGVTRYVAKPYRNEELAQVLRASIDIVQMGQLLREMHGRLIQSGQTETVQAVQREIAHELGNMIQALKHSLEYTGDLMQSARRSLDDDPLRAATMLDESLESHADSQASALRLEQILERLRAGTRAAKRDARSDVARVVQSTVRILRHNLESAASIQVTIDAEPLAAIDATSLAQVTVNLLTNAAQALASSETAEPTISVRVGSTDSRATVAITDNGPGIPREQQERVFDAHFTTKPEGQGLGLALAKRMIEDAGGTIRVESEPGGGTTFQLELALADS